MLFAAPHRPCGLSIFVSTVFFATICFFAFVTVAHAAPSAAPARLSVEITPDGLTSDEEEKLTRQILETPRVREVLKNVSYRVVASELNHRTHSPALASQAKNPPDSALGYSLQIYDYTNDRLISVSGSMDELDAVLMSADEEQPLPTHDEFLLALDIISRDPVLGPAIRSGELNPYEAMPMLMEYDPAQSRRVLPVGLRPAAGAKYAHEIVAVDLSRSQVIRYSRRSPSDSIAKVRTCGPRSALQRVTRKGTPGSAVITVKNGKETLWKLKVIRPSASSGRWGSGIELRDIRYKNELVLSRAHSPILNVRYANDVCGPYRDPVNQENAYVARGKKITSGILRASQMPSTVFDSNVDRGDYWGVALYETANEVVLTSELSAGWYRYVSEYRFYPDGTIKPTFRFSSVHNSCTCQSHVHHIYWRFDFDVGGVKEPNSVAVKNQKEWRLITSEEKHRRDEDHQAWWVYNSRSGSGYQIVPGPNDIASDEWGRGDAWILKQSAKEIDDRRVGGGSKDVKLDRFVNSENVNKADVVLWYAGHVVHSDGNESPHVVGPIISPLNAKLRAR